MNNFQRLLVIGSFTFFLLFSIFYNIKADVDGEAGDYEFKLNLKSLINYKGPESLRGFQFKLAPNKEQPKINTKYKHIYEITIKFNGENLYFYDSSNYSDFSNDREMVDQRADNSEKKLRIESTFDLDNLNKGPSLFDTPLLISSYIQADSSMDITKVTFYYTDTIGKFLSRFLKDTVIIHTERTAQRAQTGYLPLIYRIEPLRYAVYLIVDQREKAGLENNTLLYFNMDRYFPFSNFKTDFVIRPNDPPPSIVMTGNYYYKEGRYPFPDNKWKEAIRSAIQRNIYINISELSARREFWPIPEIHYDEFYNNNLDSKPSITVNIPDLGPKDVTEIPLRKSDFPQAINIENAIIGGKEYNEIKCSQLEGKLKIRINRKKISIPLLFDYKSNAKIIKTIRVNDSQLKNPYKPDLTPEKKLVFYKSPASTITVDFELNDPPRGYTYKDCQKKNYSDYVISKTFYMKSDTTLNLSIEMEELPKIPVYYFDAMRLNEKGRYDKIFKNVTQVIQQYESRQIPGFLLIFGLRRGHFEILDENNYNRKWERLIDRNNSNGVFLNTSCENIGDEAIEKLKDYYNRIYNKFNKYYPKKKMWVIDSYFLMYREQDVKDYEISSF